MYSHYQAATQESNTNPVWKKLSEGLLDSCWRFSKPMKWPVQQAAVFHGDNSRQLTCPSPPLICWILFSLWSADRKHRWHCIKDQRCASYFDYGALICSEQTADLEPCWWMSGGACCRWHNRRRAGESDRESECGCSHQIHLIGFFAAGIHHLPTIVLLGDWLQNFNKSAHTNNTQRHNKRFWFQNEEF